MELSAFAKIAPYLTHPLTLAGFVLFLFFGIHRLLIKSEVIPPIPKTEAPRIVRMFLSYGLVIAISIIVAGFGLQAYQSSLEAAGDQTSATTTQETHGDSSPTVSDTKGDVKITIRNQPGSGPEGSQ
jgi:hypothetical protein